VKWGGGGEFSRLIPEFVTLLFKIKSDPNA